MAKKLGKETTGIQSTAINSVSFGTQVARTVTRDTTYTFAQLRTARAYPTIRIAREISVAPIVAGSWSVEEKEAPEGAADFIEDLFLTKRTQIIERIVKGEIDFGHQTFENVFGINDDGQVTLVKLKPLLQDITRMLIDGFGNHIGVEQGMGVGGSNQVARVQLFGDKMSHFAIDVEGVNYYGESRLQNARVLYDEWVSSKDGMNRYANKVAGANWVVRYPPGSTPMLNGTDKSNFELAELILANLESSGGTVVPQLVTDFLKDLGANAQDQIGWKIELISDSSTKLASWIPSLEYWDSLMARAMLWPERAFQEGRFGTKAEAGQHKDLGTITLDNHHQEITDGVNRQLVNRLLSVNYGPDAVDSVWLGASPLVDEKIEFVRELYKLLLEASPTVVALELSKIDLDAMRQTLGIPVRDDVEDEDIAATLFDENVTDPIGQEATGNQNDGGN